MACQESKLFGILVYFFSVTCCRTMDDLDVLINKWLFIGSAGAEVQQSKLVIKNNNSIINKILYLAFETLLKLYIGIFVMYQTIYNNDS